jgi:hypothetical protein
VGLFDPGRNRTGSRRIEDRRRADVFDTQSNRTGYAITEGDRLDFFGVRSNRVGSARIMDREPETFDRQGKRMGLGRWPGGRGR